MAGFLPDKMSDDAAVQSRRSVQQLCKETSSCRLYVWNISVSFHTNSTIFNPNCRSSPDKITERQPCKAHPITNQDTIRLYRGTEFPHDDLVKFVTAICTHLVDLFKFLSCRTAPRSLAMAPIKISRQLSAWGCFIHTQKPSKVLTTRNKECPEVVLIWSP